MASTHLVATLALTVAAFAPHASAFTTLPTLPRASSLRSTTCKGALRMQEGGSPKPELGLAKLFVEGNEQVEEVFSFLQSTTYRKEREGFLLGEIFADRVIREGGFTEFAETVNGRVAQVAFPLAVLETGNGDLLTQLSDHPVKAMLLSALIVYASLPPLFESAENDRRGASLFKMAVPPEARRGLMNFYTVFELDKIFTPAAERTNSRAAMFAMGFYLLTATIF
jgi:hypothetical protein